MKPEWKNIDNIATVCIVPEGKMYAYHYQVIGHWYIPLVATVWHDGILPVDMRRKLYGTRDEVIAAMEDWYYSTRKEQPDEVATQENQ